jgi:hypothetical protein
MVVMNQHDSLSFECSNDMDPNEVRAVLEERVCFPVRGFPVITADWELGQSWGGASKWKDGMVAQWDGERWVLVDGSSPQGKTQAVDGTLDEGLTSADSSVNQTQVTMLDPRKADALESGAPGRRRTGSVVIHASRTPDRESFGRLLQLVASTRGETEVVLKCPAGEVPLGTSSLSLHDSGRVSMILGGAMLTADVSSEDLQTLASELTL